MISKIERNKLNKEKSLFDAGYDLFINQGINDTSISQISKAAGVGKGTFYLYFKDKYDLLDRITIRKSSEILNEAQKITEERQLTLFTDQVDCFIESILMILENERLLLKLIHKNLSWPLLQKAIHDHDNIQSVYTMFKKGYIENILATENIDVSLYMIIELTGSIAYNAIIKQEPYDLETIKPHLFSTINKIIME